MEKEPFSKRELVRLIWPLVIEQFLAVTIGMADTVMVATSGEAAVSGISLVDAVNTLLIQIFAALATGGAVVASQYLGSQNREGACRSAKQLLYTITAMASGITVLSVIFCRQILRFVFGGIAPDVMSNAQTYYYLTALSYPFMAIYNAGAALYRSMGNSRISMVVSILMNLINIVGNAILIYGFNWGVAGAGTATLLSRIVAAVLMLILIKEKENLIFIENIFRFEFHPDMIRKILAIGVPNGLENGMFQVGKLLVQNLITTFGTSAIAANAIANSVSSFSNIPGNAIGLGLITVVGQCVGAEDYDHAVFYTKRLMKAAYLSMGMINVALFLFAGPIVGVFHLSAAATASASQILTCFAVFNAVIWPVSFTLPNALRAAGDARFTMVTSMLSMWVFRIGFSYILSLLLGLGLPGTWFAMYIDWVVRSLVFLIRFSGGKWKQRRVI
ncbi:MATE family efflux transporter [Caproiciproducens sp. NJN-50]|uniref:MATE family efflux transporter n=1 Tax=Acutalibacteraceae TaxID=3082771 RepID=UPI000FFE036A|nr:MULTISPECIES: MATE family efflux transporter [Acutalibacteraceae]QAT50496.1 MATE family efflux transporter [Caproiciproducens sp. NJN-50]